LPLFLAGNDEVAFKTYEQLLGNAVGVVASPGFKPGDWRERIRAPFIKPLGFARDQALLPHGPRSFEGYRLLHEYFAFPQRFLLVELDNLAAAARRCGGSRLQLVVLLDRAVPMLEHNLDAERFLPFCVPAINLFPKKADPVHLSDRRTEYQVVPDRTRPLDFEVYRVTGAVGYGTGATPPRTFYPLYALDAYTEAETRAYYTVHRVPRLSARQVRYKQHLDRDYEPPSRYLGNEVYLALVDNREAPYPSDLRQLSVETLCTNRHLPLDLAIGSGDTDFTVQAGAPVTAVRCVAGPTEPRAPFPEGETVWRLISHLALNYLSLVEENGDGQEGAKALREMLALYAPISEAAVEKQIQGLREVASRPVVRRVPLPGPVVFGRGLEITLTCDENAFEGGGVFLFGAVLEDFFAKYVSINSFTETAIRTRERGEVMRWPPRLGRRRSL
jgi:type VI secretion system protein ImpG